MKRTRHKRVPSPRRRALEFIAAHLDGCTEALLAAENIPADILIELVQSGLVIARNERLEDEDGAVEMTRVGITEAGERVLAARGVGADGQEEKSPPKRGIAPGELSKAHDVETSRFNIWGSFCCPHWREATGDRPAEVIHRIGWPQR